jgi:hypothetical protein
MEGIRFNTLEFPIVLTQFYFMAIQFILYGWDPFNTLCILIMQTVRSIINDLDWQLWKIVSLITAPNPNPTIEWHYYSNEMMYIYTPSVPYYKKFFFVLAATLINSRKVPVLHSDKDFARKHWLKVFSFFFTAAREFSR